MKIKIFFAVALCVLSVSVSGCIPTPDGHTTPGWPLVKDTKISQYPRPVDQLVAATRTVLNRNGKLLVDNVVNNTFEAKVNESKVWVKITKIDDKTTQLQVMARTHAGGGDIDLAAEIDKQIALQLTVNP